MSTKPPHIQEACGWHTDQSSAFLLFELIGCEEEESEDLFVSSWYTMPLHDLFIPMAGNHAFV